MKRLLDVFQGFEWNGVNSSFIWIAQHFESIGKHGERKVGWHYGSCRVAVGAYLIIWLSSKLQGSGGHVFDQGSLNEVSGWIGLEELSLPSQNNFECSSIDDGALRRFDCSICIVSYEILRGISVICSRTILMSTWTMPLPWNSVNMLREMSSRRNFADLFPWSVFYVVPVGVRL
jgi:hypothetical protein